MVASEPLHDLKGRILNMVTELPHILQGETATRCSHLIDCCLSKQKKSGADLRRLAIQIYLLLKDLDCSCRASVEKGDSQVSHVAKNLSKLSGTTVKASFIRHREDSWCNHLQRISPFLTAGEGVWWAHVDGGYHFHDGDDDPHSENDFTLLHFRQHSLVDIQERRKRCWSRIVDERIAIPSRIVDERIAIPAAEVKLYDQDGNCTGRLQYSSGIPTFIPHSAGISTLNTACYHLSSSFCGTLFQFCGTLPDHSGLW